MDLSNRIALVTGASSGIGLATARHFAALKANVLICARRQERLKALAKELSEQYGVKVHAFACDVRDAEAVEAAFKALPPQWQDIDILVNSAGLSLGLDKIQDADTKDWDQVIDTNIKGVLYITRLVLQRMLQRQRGHIINLGSISAYQVYSGGVVYCATKFALRAISEGLKMDVHGTPIRISSVDPGMVDTEFSTVRFREDKEKAAAVYRGLQPLSADDIAEAIVFCATRPAHVDVREIKIYPTAQTASFMVHRE